jgi:hypothetical protein
MEELQFEEQDNGEDESIENIEFMKNHFSKISEEGTQEMQISMISNPVELSIRNFAESKGTEDNNMFNFDPFSFEN